MKSASIGMILLVQSKMTQTTAMRGASGMDLDFKGFIALMDFILSLVGQEATTFRS